MGVTMAIVPQPLSARRRDGLAILPLPSPAAQFLSAEVSDGQYSSGRSGKASTTVRALAQHPHHPLSHPRRLAPSGARAARPLLYFNRLSRLPSASQLITQACHSTSAFS